MKQTCTLCRQSFEVTSEDLAFYDKVSPVFNGKKEQIPSPTLCPDCRMQRRIAFRNFFNLYHRSCDLSGKKILSMYQAGTPFPVYEAAEWWSDKWDGLTYGREPDLSRPFFEQFAELYRVVPRMNVMNTQCENVDYCSLSRSSKNCYLVFGNIGNEDCYYGHIVWQSKQCVDCLYVYRSERCYECVDCVECYNVAYARDCDGCSDSRFLVGCSSCKNCFGCVGLVRKEFCFFNEQLTKEQYEKRMAEYRPGSYRQNELAMSRTLDLAKNRIVKHYHGRNCEDVTGDYLYNSRNVTRCFDLKNSEDCRYCATLESFKDAMDTNFSPAKTELVLENVFVVGYKIAFCHNVMNDSSDMYYGDHCFGCRDCFGCIGLKNKRYCILNKQYSKEEYEALVPKIIEKMRTDGEWGEYFPMSLSPFAYNETVAQEYFPLSESEARERGLLWKEDDAIKNPYLGPKVALPDDIKDVEDDICEKILLCEKTNRPYKIIPQELRLYGEMGIPLPRKCFDQRHKERMALRNPRTLWSRECMKCKKAIQTTYAPDRPEIVYCEACYLATVY